MSDTNEIKYSIVVPLYNEEQVVDELYQRLCAVMEKTGDSYELVLVDDGSKDGTLEKVKALVQQDEHVVLVELRRNYGQTPALAAGFDNTRGEIIISMDGDLQHLPEEIPNFLEKLDEGYDVVSGWRQKRVDNLVMRKIPSRIANMIAQKISGVEIHDFGTTFRAYKREVIDDLVLYGEMHRFIPALLAGSGFNIIEVPIKNIERPHGESNYGISRTFRVAFDLITLRFLLGYVTRPLHFFGNASLCCFAAVGALMCYLLFDKLYFNVPIFLAHGPLALVAMVLLLIGFIFISTGLIGELICRVYFEATNNKIYTVRKIYNKS